MSHKIPVFTHQHGWDTEFCLTYETQMNSGGAYHVQTRTRTAVKIVFEINSRWLETYC